MSKYLSFQGKILLLAFLFSVVVIEWADKSFREEICSGIPQRSLESDSELSGSESIEIGEDILVDLVFNIVCCWFLSSRMLWTSKEWFYRPLIWFRHD